MMADTIAYTRQLSEVCEIENDKERIKQYKRHWTQLPKPDNTNSDNAGKSKHTGGVLQQGQPNESSTTIGWVAWISCLLRKLWRGRSTCYQYPNSDSGEDEEPDSDSEEEEEPHSDSGEEMELNNDEEVFEALQRNPDWGTFFHKFRECELVMAEKPFAEGGQAKVYAAQIKWFNSSPSKEELKDPWKWVLKVFKKKGQPLQALQKQWPQGMLQFQKVRCHAGSVRRFNCDVVCGTLLEDGRFAFLMQREKEDLRHCIERNMKLKRSTAWTPWRNLRQFGPFPKEVVERLVYKITLGMKWLRDCGILAWTPWRNLWQFGPFSIEVAVRLMYEIALGMKWLHDRSIIHRDLKASNVLLNEDTYQSYCFVADYECSEGVEGTNFWRAPEILEAIKFKVEFEERKKLFTKAADVYSYGMTCYEILTGKVPFKDHKVNDYDVVLEGQSKLEVPYYAPKWLHELLSNCWQVDPKQRPTFEKILEEFKNHGGLCMTEDIAHSKYKWSQLILTIRMSMLTEFEEFWSASEEFLSPMEKFRSALKEFLSPMEEFRTARSPMEHFHTALEDAFEVFMSNLIDNKYINIRYWDYQLETLEFDIESCTSHWTEVTVADTEDEEDWEVDNIRQFEDLQRDPKWGSFFRTFGYDTEVFLSSGSLKIGEKFAEGGQAKIFKVHVTWASEETNEYDQKNNREWVLKVYEEGYSLHELQRQWPEGLCSYHAQRVESTKRGYSLRLKNVCDVVCGTLLEDGRFAHLLERHQGNLRQFIDFNMELRSNYDCGPFSKEVAEGIIFEVALGMDWVHSYDIVHRDVKASNVLVTEDRDGEYQCFVSDYECSNGVLGTGFWRAPEILQAIKERSIGANREILFTKAIDVYGFGMTCYEILSGEIPFKDSDPRDYDLVLRGERPMLPKYVAKWTCELLSLCWQVDPARRPSFKEILDLILLNSPPARRLKEIRRDEIETGHFSLPMRNDEIFLGESFLGRILCEA